MNTIPIDFPWEDPPFVQYKDTKVPEEYRHLLRRMTVEELAALSDNELARRQLLMNGWFSMQSSKSQKEPKESEDDKRLCTVLDVEERYPFKTMFDTEEIYYYEGGVFKPGGEKIIKSLVREIRGSEVTSKFVSEIVSAIRDTRHTDRADFDTDPNILNLKNGLLNIATGEFKEHTPAHLSLVQLPVAYNPKATCKEVTEFLYDIILDPSYVPVILEYIGYCMLHDKDLQKELLMVGAPDSGKSRFLFLLTALLGTQNISNVTMQQLSTNRFATAQLEGKLVNIYADISHARLEDIERFNAIATADEMEVEKKGMQMHKMKPRAKLIFSANMPPKPPINVDDSFYRRWLLLQCALRERHYFSGKPIVRDPKMLSKLTTPENLSGLLNLALISARRIMKTQKFCKEVSTDETRELYNRLCNPVKMWMERCCEEDEDATLEKTVAYQSYVKFCKDRKIGVLNDVWHGKEMSLLGVLDGKRGNSRKVQVKVWQGLRLKETGLGKPPFTPSIEKSTSTVQKGKEPLPSPGLSKELVN